MKKIHVLTGVAGVGKSTYIEKHKNDIDIVLSSDELRLELYGSLTEGNKHNQEVFNELHKRIKNAIETCEGDIYFDATNISRRNGRMKFYNRYKKLAHDNGYEIQVDLLHKPLQEIKDQNNERTGDKRVPEYVLDRMYRGLQTPVPGLDCDNLVIEAPDISTYASEINHRIDEPHNSPYHAETLREHMEMVNQAAIESKSPHQKKLAELAIHHDLGKAVCRQKNQADNLAVRYINGVYGEHDRYMGHENVGAIYYLIKNQHNLTPEVFQMAIMIEYHMMAHDKISEKLIKIDGVTDEMLEILSEFADIDSKARVFDSEIFDHYQKLLETTRDNEHVLTKAMKTEYMIVSSNFDRDLYTLKYAHGGVDFSNKEMRNARGLTYDLDGNMVTIGFEKFFNYKQLEDYDKYDDAFKQEYSDTSIDGKFDVYEKLDGTFITLGLDKNDDLVAATSQSTRTNYTTIAENYFNQLPNINEIKKYMKDNNMSLMFEYTNPKNMLIIPYDEEKFTLIGARERDLDAKAINYETLTEISEQFNLDIASKQTMTLDEVIEYQRTNRDTEGFVALNEYGRMLKFKTDYWFEQKNKTGELFFGDSLTKHNVQTYVDLYIADELDDLIAYKNQHYGKHQFPEISEFHKRLIDRVDHYKHVAENNMHLDRMDIVESDMPKIEKSLTLRAKDLGEFTIHPRTMHKIGKEIAQELRQERVVDKIFVELDLDSQYQR